MKQVEQKQSMQTSYFDELAVAIAMLIENINMQMESECQDMIERRSISLYAGAYNLNREQDKIEVTKTSNDLKTFGARHRSFA